MQHQNKVFEQAETAAESFPEESQYCLLTCDGFNDLNFAMDFHKSKIGQEFIYAKLFGCHI